MRSGSPLRSPWYLGRSVFAPVGSFAVCTRDRMAGAEVARERLPQLAALAITLLLTVIVFGTLMALSILVSRADRPLADRQCGPP